MSNYFDPMQKLVDNFLLDVGKGHGWNGLIAANNWPVIYNALYTVKFGNDCVISELRATITWKTGEVLRFLNFETENKYWFIHGAAFQWIGILGDVLCADKILTTLRCYDPAVSKKVRIIYA